MPETLKRIRDLSVVTDPTGLSLPLDADSLGASETKRITADDFFAWVAGQLDIPAVSGSDGYVQFGTSGDLDSDSKFFWDKTNHRLGINTVLPSVDLDVRGRILADRTAVTTLSNPNQYFLSVTNFNTDGGVGYAEVSFGVATDGGLIQTLGGVDLWLNRTGNAVRSGGNFVPTATNTLDLGTTAIRWNNAYIATLTLSNPLAIANGGTGAATTSAHFVFIGPTSGGAAAPSFRALVAGDIPDLSGTYQSVDADLTAIAALSGTGIARRTGANTWSLGTVVGIAEGGTGQTTANDALNALLPTQTSNAGYVLTTDGTNASWLSLSGVGTVTSVAMTVPNILSVSGSPITGAGTLALTLATQAANKFFSGPSTGADATPTFRYLTVADLPDLSSYFQPLDGDLTAIAALSGTGIARRTGSNTWTLGTTVSIAEGGTGQTTANAAFNALAPDQTGNSGKLLTTNATNTSWVTVTATMVSYDATNSGLSTSNVQTTLDVLNELIVKLGGNLPAPSTRLLSGGGVVWISSFTFMVSSAVYYINGTLYSSSQQSISLTAADATYDRFDLICVDDTGTVVKITGTPSSTPTIPTADSSSQLILTVVSVPAASTSPPATTNLLLYDDNVGTPTEWNASTSGTGFVVNSTNNPYNGTRDIEGTDVNNQAYVQLQGGSAATPNNYQNVVFYIRSKAAWTQKASLLLGFYLNGVLVGTTVSMPLVGAGSTGGFYSGNTTTYQQIVIPITNFTIPPNSTANQLRFIMRGGGGGGGGGPGFYLDSIFLQATSNSGNTAFLTQDQGDSRYLRRSSNLSDIALASTARTNLGLGNVENTALSTWAGTTNITTLGTITTGTWNGTTIGTLKGGTGLTSYTLGDLLYASASNVISVLAGNTTTTTKVLSQTGNGTISAAPAWITVPSSVANSDGTLTISPTTGSVVASLNLAHLNTWTVTQVFSQGTGAGISVVMKPASGSPTGDIFEVTNNAGSTVYDVCDVNGNMFPLPVVFNLAGGTAAATGSNLTGVGVMPFSGKIIKAWAVAKTGPTGADLIFDINLNGSTIWSTQSNRLKIVASATTGNQTSFNTTTFVAGDQLTIDIDQVGSTIAGQDITVVLSCVCTNNSTNSGNAASGSIT